MLTFSDLVDHVLAYLGTAATRAQSENHRRAVLNAYSMLPTVHEWTYYWTIFRIQTSASYSTGTLAYDHTGGATERRLTLTGGTWPSWAALGHVRINDVPYDIEARVSDTVLTLSELSNPGADTTSDEGYWAILRDTYSLPANFTGGDETVTNEIGGVLNFVHPRDWSSSRRVNTGPGRPQIYTFTGDPTTYGRTAVRMWPPPDAVYNIDMLYRRKPRAMVFDQVDDGLVSVTAADATVTGDATRFAAAHVGSVIRLSSSADVAPTGPAGLNPAVFETTIASFTSTTSVELTDAPTQSLAGVKYVISDPADIDPVTQEQYLLREIEKHARLVARVEPLRQELAEYDLAIERAREADTKSTAPRAALRYKRERSGLKYFPRGSDS